MFLLAAAVRVAFVERQGLWVDEIFSLAMATGHSLEHPAADADPAKGDFVESPRPESLSAYARYLHHEQPPAGPGRVIRAVRLSDTSPPLYYVLLYSWTRAFGTGAAALRSFSVLASLACLPLLWRLGRALGGRTAALVATLLFALVPPSVYYSTEGRMYSLQWLFTLGLMWQTWRMGRGRAGLATAALWIAVGAAGLLTHYFVLFVWAAAILLLIIHPGPWKRRTVFLCGGLTVLLIAPWYVHIPETLGRWHVTTGWLQLPPYGYSPVLSVLSVPWSYLSLRVFAGGPTRWDAVNLALYLALAIAVLALRGRPRLTRSRLLVAMWLLAACVGPVAWDAVFRTYAVAVPRYAIAGMPAAFLVIGLAAARLGPVLRVALVGPILLLCVLGLQRFGHVPSRNGRPLREIGARVAREARPDDLVIVHSIPSGVCGVARYIEEAQGSGPGPGFASWVGQLEGRGVPEDLETLIAGRSRVFFVRVHDVGAPAPEQEWLEANAVPVGRGGPDGIPFLVFGPREGTAFFPSGRASPLSENRYPQSVP